MLQMFVDVLSFNRYLLILSLDFAVLYVVNILRKHVCFLSSLLICSFLIIILWDFIFISINLRLQNFSKFLFDILLVIDMCFIFSYKTVDIYEYLTLY
jgi:hypothetical protein